MPAVLQRSAQLDKPVAEAMTRRIKRAWRRRSKRKAWVQNREGRKGRRKMRRTKEDEEYYNTLRKWGRC